MKSILDKENGFTLLEALIALMLSSTIILLLSGGLLQMDKIRGTIISDSQLAADASGTVEGDRQIEWHLFLNQLENYLEGSNPRYVQTSGMRVEEWDEERQRFVEVRYGVTQSSISNFMRSSSRGYNRMLSGISDYTLTKKDHLLLLDFTFKNGENYKGRIGIDSWAKEGATEKE